jgi:hypothetical protein
MSAPTGPPDPPAWEPEPAPVPAPGPGMTVGSVLEVGVGIMRRQLWVLLALAFVFQGPAALLTSAAGLFLADAFLEVFPGLATGEAPTRLELSASEQARLLEASALLLGATALGGVMGSITALSHTAIVAADHDGRRTTFREAAVLALRRAVVGFGVVIVSTLVILGVAALAVGAAIALLVVMPPPPGGGGPGVFLALVVAVAAFLAIVVLTVRWTAAIPVAALEAGGPLRALARSWRLTAGHGWRTLAVLVIGGLGASIVGALIGQVLAIVVVDVVAARMDALVAGELVVGLLASVLVAPIVPVIVAVLYHDLRLRRDSNAEADATAGSTSPGAS